MTFRSGVAVRITFQGKTISGEVLLASDNGLSMVLTLDDYLGTYRSFMPVLWVEHMFVDLLLAEPVIIVSQEGN